MYNLLPSCKNEIYDAVDIDHYFESNNNLRKGHYRTLCSGNTFFVGLLLVSGWHIKYRWTMSTALLKVDGNAFFLAFWRMAPFIIIKTIAAL